MLTMKPIFTVILSTLGVTLLCGLAFVINLDAAIKKEASKYSKADYAMMTKTVSFPGSVEKLHVATGLDADYYVKDTTGIKVIVTAEDLQTLLGANTVWTDCGSVTGMTYRADTALYIDKKLGA